jgi:hypothetical protein
MYKTYAGTVSPDLILMGDKARAHRANITNRYLEEATIVHMDWEARSPDSNRACLGYAAESRSLVRVLARLHIFLTLRHLSPDVGPGLHIARGLI